VESDDLYWSAKANPAEKLQQISANPTIPQNFAIFDSFNLFIPFV
jgi:hypothetical protein